MQTHPGGVHKGQETGESLFKKMRRVVVDCCPSIRSWGAVAENMSLKYIVLTKHIVADCKKYQNSLAEISLNLKISQARILYRTYWKLQETFFSIVYFFSATLEHCGKLTKSSHYSYFLKFIKGSWTKSLAYFIIDHLDKAVGSSLVFHILKTSKKASWKSTHIFVWQLHITK